MLLRRVIEHVKAQNWTAVVIDFLVVVAGVFVGMQVTNWNSGREAHALGEDYVRRLTADLERDLRTTRNIVDYYTAVVASVEEADRLLSDANPDSRQLVIAAYRASEFATTPPNRAVWDQIVSSGHLGLLPDRVIDSGLSEYYTFIESNAYTENIVQVSKYRQTVRSIIPLPMQIAIREGCSDVVTEYNVIIGFAPECRLSVDQSLLDETAEKLRSNQSIREDLRYQYSTVVGVRNNRRGDVVLIERALAAVKGLEQMK